MPYQRADASCKRWAPFEFVWRCEFCINVFWIDGSINPNELTAEKRIQIKERKMLYVAIRHISFSDLFSIKQIKSAQENLGASSMVTNFNPPCQEEDDEDGLS